MLFGFAAAFGLLLATPIAARAQDSAAESDFEFVKGAHGLEALADAELADIRGGFLSANANAPNPPRRKVILWDEAHTMPAPVVKPGQGNCLDFRSVPGLQSAVAITR
jgi:hypothetical protein